DLRFVLPDPVLAVPEAERDERIWSGGDLLLSVRDVGSFVRVMVPIRLTGGSSVTFGAWLGVSPEDFERARVGWWEPSYASLRLEGLLANALPPWEAETYGRRLVTAVLDPDQLPVATGTDDPDLHRVL